MPMHITRIVSHSAYVSRVLLHVHVYQPCTSTRCTLTASNVFYICTKPQYSHAGFRTSTSRKAESGQLQATTVILIFVRCLAAPRKTWPPASHLHCGFLKPDPSRDIDCSSQFQYRTMQPVLMSQLARPGQGPLVSKGDRRAYTRGRRASLTAPWCNPRPAP
jgi:hypothetical protein